jgi:hypothetical protein
MKSISLRIGVLAFLCMSMLVLRSVHPSYAQNTVQAQGQEAIATQGQMPTETVSDLEVDMLAKALAMRNAGADSMRGFADVYPALSPILRTELTQEKPDIWSYFMRGATLHLDPAGGARPVIGFYNPWLDSWLFTRWKVQGDELSALENAVVMPHDGVLRNRDFVNAPASWRVALDHGYDVDHLFEQQSQSAITDFDTFAAQGDWDAVFRLRKSAKETAQNIVKKRLFQEILSLTTLMSNANALKATNALMLYINDGQSQAFIRQSVPQLHNIVSDAGFSELLGYGYVFEPRSLVEYTDQGQDYMHVMLSPADQPKLALVATIFASGAQQGMIKSLYLGHMEGGADEHAE